MDVEFTCDRSSSFACSCPRLFQVSGILRILMDLIAEYKGSAANALFNYQALDADDDEDDEDYDG